MFGWILVLVAVVWFLGVANFVVYVYGVSCGLFYACCVLMSLYS